MPRYRSDGSVTVVRLVKKNGRSRGFLRRPTTNNTYYTDLSLQHVQIADLQMEQDKNNNLDLK